MRYYFTVAMMVGLIAVAAHAQSVEKYVHALKPLAISYGANLLSLGDHELLITKGHVASEAAGGGDSFSVFIEQDATWQLARIGDQSRNQTAFWSIPHTDEDVVASIYFLTSQDRDDLYVLEARKDYKTSLAEVAPIHFTLYQLKKAEDFDIYCLMRVAHEVSKQRYINADVAFHQEFGLE